MNEQQQRALAAGLNALAETSRGARASERVEDAVLAAMASTSASVEAGFRRPVVHPVDAGFSRPVVHPVEAGFSRPAGWFSYAAAAALLLVSLSGAWIASGVGRSLPGPIHPAGFVEIPGTSALPLLESGSIVRVSLPVASLPHYGLPIAPDAPTLFVDAEFLLAQDGMPRAIRLVNDSQTQIRSTP